MPKCENHADACERRCLAVCTCVSCYRRGCTIATGVAVRPAMVLGGVCATRSVCVAMWQWHPYYINTIVQSVSSAEFAHRVNAVHSYCRHMVRHIRCMSGDATATAPAARTRLSHNNNRTPLASTSLHTQTVTNRETERRHRI